MSFSTKGGARRTTKHRSSNVQPVKAYPYTSSSQCSSKCSAPYVPQSVVLTTRCVTWSTAFLPSDAAKPCLNNSGRSRIVLGRVHHRFRGRSHDPDIPVALAFPEVVKGCGYSGRMLCPRTQASDAEEVLQRYQEHHCIRAFGACRGTASLLLLMCLSGVLLFCFM